MSVEYSEKMSGTTEPETNELGFVVGRRRPDSGPYTTMETIGRYTTNNVSIRILTGKKMKLYSRKYQPDVTVDGDEEAASAAKRSLVNRNMRAVSVR